MTCSAALLAATAAEDRCAYVQANCTEVGNAYFGSYVEHWHCTFGESPMALLPLGVWLAMLIAALCSTADTFLIPQLSYISTYLRLKPDVAGVTLLAFGNGAPDVFTGIAVSKREEVDFSLLLADLVGGSIFIMTVVVGAVVWVRCTLHPHPAPCTSCTSCTSTPCTSTLHTAPSTLHTAPSSTLHPPPSPRSRRATRPGGG